MLPYLKTYVPSSHHTIDTMKLPVNKKKTELYLNSATALYRNLNRVFVT